MDKSLVSIIIPAYNAAQHIKECLSSVLLQSYHNIEVVVVDDGSKDDSLEIIKKIANEDSRIRVVAKENGGVSSARNAGLDVAQGEWVTFIDSDDWVEADYITNLVENVDGNALIIQGMRKVNGSVIEYIDYGDCKYEASGLREAFENGQLEEKGFVSGKLYNRCEIERCGLRFNREIHYAEDLIFMLEYVLNVGCVKYINGTKYNYRIEASSLSQRVNPYRSEHLLFEEYDRLTRAIAEKYSFTLGPEALRYGALHLFRGIYAMYSDASLTRNDRLIILKDVKTKHRSFITANYKPNAPVMKIAKRLFFISNLLFDWFNMERYKKL